MSKKDFIFIAETIKSQLVNEGGDFETLRGLALQFCGRLSAINERFDQRRFLEACGVNKK